MSTHNSNTACCSIPPVQGKYQPKGEYKPFEQYKNAYIVGSDNPDLAVIAVYDIFGYWPQSQQGSDILAETLKCKVIMPDIFEGKPFDLKKFPPDTDENKKALQEFFGVWAKFPNVWPPLLNASQTLRESGVKKVVIYGLCWGGKLATVSGSQTVTVHSNQTPAFDAVAAIHPAMLSTDDAKALSVPYALFPSKDEPLEEFEKIVEHISTKPFAKKNAYKVYDTMFHGFAGARGDLEKEDNKKEFADVYARLATFFKEA